MTANSAVMSAQSGKAAGGGSCKVKKKRVRRQREELLYLRKKAQELQQKLAEVAQRQAAHSAAVEDQSLMDRPDATMAWKSIADRQRLERTRVESENLRLKRMLRDQIELASGLEKLLQTDDLHLLDTSTRSSCEQGNPVLGVKTQSPDARDTLESVLEDLNVLYATAESVMANAKATASVPMDINLQVMDDNGVAISYRANVIVPFDVAIVTRALWRMVVLEGFDLECRRMDWQEKSEDLIVRNMTISVDSCSGQWDVHQVMRKFTEAERTVIVASSLWVSAPSGCSSKFRGTRFCETLQLVASRVIKQGASTTAIKAFVRAVPQFMDESAMDIGTLTEFVLGSADARLNRLWPIIQDLLIQEDWLAAAGQG